MGAMLKNNQKKFDWEESIGRSLLKLNSDFSPSDRKFQAAVYKIPLLSVKEPFVLSRNIRVWPRFLDTENVHQTLLDHSLVAIWKCFVIIQMFNTIDNKPK